MERSAVAKLAAAVGLFVVAGAVWWMSRRDPLAASAPTGLPASLLDAATSDEQRAASGADRRADMPSRDADDDVFVRATPDQRVFTAMAARHEGLAVVNHPVAGRGVQGVLPLNADAEADIGVVLTLADYDLRTAGARPTDGQIRGLDRAVAAMLAWLGSGDTTALLGDREVDAASVASISSTLDAWRARVISGVGAPTGIRVQPPNAPRNPCDIDLRRYSEATGLLGLYLQRCGLTMSDIDPSGAVLAAGAEFMVTLDAGSASEVDLDLLWHEPSGAWWLLAVTVEAPEGSGTPRPDRLLWPAVSQAAALAPGVRLSSVRGS